MKALVILLIGLVSACGARAETTADPRDRAAAWLWSKQGPDGGWHSETYGLLRSGQSLTPLILLALEGTGSKEARDRAIAFIRASRDPEYPNYAAALAIGIGDAAALRRQQFTEDNGWTKDHPAYGAWGMGGPVRKPPHTGHVDLSMTRHVLQAIGDPSGRAKVFLDRCRNADGGFMFSPVILEANKAGVGKSYGTATADGILSLLALGEPVDAPLAWLRKHHRTDGVPGFEDGKWRDGMLYYYLSASSQAFKAAKADGWQKDMIRALAALQRADGSFKNDNFIMKEDDPLIATALALLALNAARS